MMATTQSLCPRGLLTQYGGLIPQFCTSVAYARVHRCTRVSHLLHTRSSVSLIREETSKSIRPTVIRGSSPSTNAVELQSASNFWPLITPRHIAVGSEAEVWGSSFTTVGSVSKLSHHASPCGVAGSRPLGVQAGWRKGLRAATGYFPGKFVLLLVSPPHFSVTAPGLSPLIVSPRLYWRLVDD